MERHILIVEDDTHISEILASFLESNGFSVTRAMDGNIASALIKNQKFDIILMDIMLPYKEGDELIRELRKFSDTPVIVISAKSMLETRLEALKIGADDYIIKPFDLNEVLVRIEVILRRTGNVVSDDDISSSDGLKLSDDGNYASYNGQIIRLTAKELSLLKLFMKYPEKVYTKANLYESVWQETYYYEDNTINVHISNLRSKLKKISGHDFIETVWGIGYRMKEE
ncbi:MAG: response regulator transcription factor [Oscillospiraceae bacterium]